MLTTTMDEVIQQMDRLLDTFRQEHNRMGYFAGLYRIVAATFREAIERKLFVQDALMRQLNLAFFQRYFDAVQIYRKGELPSRVWLLSFRAAQSRNPIVLQHLLLGINAHIHLDLGIAVARVCPAEQFAQFAPDFQRMNDVLASLIEEIKQDLVRVWPALGLLERSVGTLDDAIFAMSLRQSRDHAWRFARELSSLTIQQQVEPIAQMDQWAHSVGQAILSPMFPMRAALSLVRLTEKGSVPEIIDLLAHQREPSNLLQRLQLHDNHNQQAESQT